MGRKQKQERRGAVGGRRELQLGTVGEGKRRELIRISGMLGGRRAVFLADTGATTEFVDAKFAAAAGWNVRQSSSRITLANGGVVSSGGITESIRYDLARVTGGAVQYSSQFEVTELSGYDAILGMSWFKEAQPQFVWDGGRPCQLQVKERSSNGRWQWKVLEAAKRTSDEERAVVSEAIAVLEVEQLHALARRSEAKVEESKEAAPAVERTRTAEEQAVFDRLMKQFSDVFPKELPDGLPPRRPGLEHRIHLKSHAKTPYRRPYRSGPTQLKLLKETLAQMLQKGFIQRSQSRFGAPVLFTPKKDGTMRMVIDYREINKVTIKNGYPLPATEELFPIVQGAKYFSKIDLHSGYYQIRIAEEDREKTAFVTRYGSYEFLVLPMGLCNSPGTFMELMNFVFENQLDRFVIVFLDDVLVFSKSLLEHEKHMKEVLQILRDQKLYAKMSKCDLVRDEVDFLGHRVGRDGLSQEKDKTAAVTAWETPKSRTEVQQFLGLAGYYRKFVKNFADIAAPMTHLTGSTVEFKWGEAEQQSFEQLKKALVEAPVLALPDMTKPFVMHTDASMRAIGAVLQQHHEGAGLKPLGYMSTTLSAAQKNYPVHDLEMLAIVESLAQWRHLLSGRRVQVKTDHHSLQHFFTQRSLNKRQVRWMEELAEYDVTIEYVKGKSNGAADALSRKEQSQESQGKEKETPVTCESLGWEWDAEQLMAMRRGAKRVRRSPEEEKADREKCVTAATKVVPLDPTQPAPDAKGVVTMPTQQCTATTKRGTRCNGKTAKGQYCYTHLKQVDGLRVKKSTVGPQAGMGLFAERDFKKGEAVTIYTGDYLDVAEGDGGGNYVLQLTWQKAIDAARTNSAPGRWANDPRGSNRRANAEFRLDHRNGTARLVAKCRIAKGVEVLVSYGRGYWAAVNRKMKAEEPTVIDLTALKAVDVVEELLKECEKSAAYLKWREELEAGKKEPGVTVEGGLIRQNGIIILPDTERAYVVAAQMCHDDAAAGHLGRDKTLARLKLRFKWKGMDQWVADYVKSCVKCQLNKDSNEKPAGLLMPLPIPTRPWQQFGIDFMGPFRMTKAGMDGIAVIVCHFSKMKHIVPISMRMSAREAVKMVMKEVVRLHGAPEVIVHDRDVRFTARFWTEYWKLMGAKLGVSTAYHPQTDGQTERENRTIGAVIRSVINEDQDDWDVTLPLVELAVNSAVQASTGVSPFKMVYGREATLPLDVVLRTPITTIANPAVEELWLRMKQLWEESQKAMGAAKSRQKQDADKKRRALEFTVGDKVLLSTAHIRLKGAKELQRSVKFAAKFIGPFPVVRVVNANAYELKLPDSFNMHAVVNVERLKRYVDGADQFPDREVDDWRPSGEKVEDENGELEWEVDKIVAQRGGERKRQYLVKWKGFATWESTWESPANLQHAKAKLKQFHRAVAQQEEQSGEQLMAIFKGVESVAGLKGLAAMTVEKEEKQEKV